MRTTLNSILALRRILNAEKRVKLIANATRPIPYWPANLGGLRPL